MHEVTTEPFPDEPEARALYDRMLAAFRDARSVFYEAAAEWRSGDAEPHVLAYSFWARKDPYGIRVEVFWEGALKGVLVGNPEQTWIFWPGGRPKHILEDVAAHQATQFTSYARKPGQLTDRLKYWLPEAGTGILPIVEPMTIWGLVDTVTHEVDAMRTLGTEDVDGQACDVLEVSAIGHTRHRFLWLSQRDSLPRKLEEVFVVADRLRKHERWVRLTLNDEFPAGRFEWQPPEGWHEWCSPEPKMLERGTEAPDFELPTLDGGTVRLADFRGKVVWLAFWKMNCPPCRREVPYLQQWHDRCADAGLVVLGINTGGADGDALLAFLRENGITFPNAVLPSWDAYEKMLWHDYPTTGVPSNYIIGRDGRVAGAWAGFDEDADCPGKEVLAKLGMTLPA